MIDDITPVNNYTGNGSTTKFDFDFLINAANELKVLHTASDGTQTTLTLNTDYTINQIGNDDGSYITFPIAGSSYGTLSAQEKISLVLDIPVAQTFPFGTSEKLNLNSLEKALDYIVRLIQIEARKTERSVKVPEGENIDTDELSQDIITVAQNQQSINTVANDVTNINAVKADLTNIDAVANDLTNINTVKADLTNIDAVANDLTNIDAVKADLTNIDTVSGNITAINGAVDNLDLIVHAYENITTVHFDSVADMKASTEIKINDIILTTGYYSANDGGGAKYRVRAKSISDVEDNATIYFLQNNLVAELINESIIYVKQFGAKGDNTADDTAAIQKAIDFAKAFDEIVFDGLFKITDEIAISKPLIVRGKQGGVHGNSAYQKRTQGIQQYTANKNIFTLYPSTVADANGKYDWSFYPTGSNPQYGLGNCVFKDLYLCGSGNNATGGTAIALKTNTNQAKWHFIYNLFENIVIENCNIGIDMTTWTVWNDNWNRVMIQKCYSAGIMFGRDDGDVGAGKLYLTDCWFYSSAIGIDCVTHSTRQINTTRCNFAYCTYGIKAHNTMDLFDYQSDFEDCTYGIYIENRNATSYTEFVLNQTVIGTNANIAASSYCIYLEPTTTGSTTTRFTIILDHCKLARAALSLQDCCYLRLIGPSVNNFTNINAPYASIEKMFHMMPNRKIGMWNTMRCAMTSGTGTTDKLFHIVELAAGKTIEIVTQVGGGLRAGTRVSSKTTIKNITTDTNILAYNRQSQEWNESEARANQVAQTYKNNSSNKEYITFTAAGTDASDEYFTAVYYAIV